MNNWHVCQINGIADYACGPAADAENLDALRELSLAFQDAIVDALPATGRGAR
jgi:hypothetical protein